MRSLVDAGTTVLLEAYKQLERTPLDPAALKQLAKHSERYDFLYFLNV
jgi:hypothetical protein